MKDFKPNPNARNKRQKQHAKMASLIFIGEKEGEKELKITEKPVFFDALQLSKPPEKPPEMPSYQFIALEKRNSFYVNDFDIQLILESGCISLIESEHHLTSGEALDIFSSFLIQQKNTYSFLAHLPNSKIKARKTGTTHVLQESKPLGK